MVIKILYKKSLTFVQKNLYFFAVSNASKIRTHSYSSKEDLVRGNVLLAFWSTTFLRIVSRSLRASLSHTLWLCLCRQCLLDSSRSFARRSTSCTLACLIRFERAGERTISFMRILTLCPRKFRIKIDLLRRYGGVPFSEVLLASIIANIVFRFIIINRSFTSPLPTLFFLPKMKPLFFGDVLQKASDSMVSPPVEKLTLCR